VSLVFYVYLVKELFGLVIIILVPGFFSSLLSLFLFPPLFSFALFLFLLILKVHVILLNFIFILIIIFIFH